MEHFKDFLIRLQTLNIKVVPQKLSTENVPGKPAYYDISQQNPYLNNAYKNELKELRELALTDILNLQSEQIMFQVKRLKEVKGLFETFWKNYHASDVPGGTENNARFFFSLNLNDLFLMPHLSAQDNAVVTDMFLDDLKDTIQAREKGLTEFEQSVARVLPIDTGIDLPAAKPVKIKENASPVFKESAAMDFYDLVKDYFGLNDQPLLKDLLTIGKEPERLLLFKGQGIQLSDAFKQLFESNLVVGCNKVELIRWIISCFTFLDKGSVRTYSEKYLQDVISSNTKICQSPILDVRKREGQFTIIPTQRTGRKSRV